MIQKLESRKLEPSLILDAEAIAGVIHSSAKAVKTVLFASEYFMRRSILLSLTGYGFKLVPDGSSDWNVMKDCCLYELRIASQPGNNGERKINLVSKASK